MVKIEIFVAILLLGGLAKCDLVEFVHQKMACYSGWLRTNGFDPTPALIGPDHLTYNDDNLTMDWDLMNHQVRGHSFGMELYSISGDLTSTPKYFNAVWGFMDGIEFYGNYSAKGSVGYPKQPISGQGKWTIGTAFAYQFINYIYFDVTPSGYLNVTGVKLEGIFPSYFPDPVYFENLLEHESAAGWEDHITSAMFQTFKKYLNRDPMNPKHPLRTLYVDYWREILSKTTLQDIIDASHSQTKCGSVEIEY